MLLGIRYRGKQKARPCRTTFGSPITEGVLHAIEVEALAVDGLLALPADSKKVNVHFTHVRTNNPKDVQPHQLSRQQFWQHLLKCFRICYPKADSPTGCILLFGMVCKERHKDAPRDADRSEHHHAPTHASESYRWKQIRKVSAERFGIQLNAVAHDTYTTMFSYLRCHTVKKPLHELDPTPYFSPGHPQGEALRTLLTQGYKYQQVRSAISGAPTVQAPPVRSMFGIAYKWVTEHNLRKRKGAVQFQADAVSELNEGRPQLLEFCKKHKTCLEDQIDYIWQLAESKDTLSKLDKSRLDILVDACQFDGTKEVHLQQCANGNCRCAGMFESVLDYHKIDSNTFRHSLFETIQFGRRKGNALMIYGGSDTGKTTVVEPLNEIFKCMKCPQADSFCPCENIRGHDVLLWQDFRYNPGHPKFDEKGLRLDIGTWNRLTEGLDTPIGVPKSDGQRSDFVYTETAPLICTGPFQPTGYLNGFPNERETDQLRRRMKFFHFWRPAPEQGQDRSFKPCALCWSRWLLDGEIAWQKSQGNELDPFLAKVAAQFKGPAPVALRPEADGAEACSVPESSGQAQPSSEQQPSNAPVELLAQLPTKADRSTLVESLCQLVAWRREGLLSATEFQNAKNKLGL